MGDLTRKTPRADASRQETFDFPEWNRSWPALVLRHLALPLLILPLTRLFAWIKVEGLENLRGLEGPVIFASNHQSHFDVPSILWALPGHWRYRVAPAMARVLRRAFSSGSISVENAIHQQPELLPGGACL